MLEVYVLCLLTVAFPAIKDEREAEPSIERRNNTIAPSSIKISVMVALDCQ